MAYGFRAYNNSGYTQIDETTVGYQVLATGVVPASNNYTINYVTIPSSYPDDILVVAKPHNPITTTNYRITSYYSDFTLSGTRYRRCYMNCAYGNIVLAIAACDYAIIQRCAEFNDGLISGQNPPNYGLNVYQSNGTLSFTTEKPTFRVRAARHHNVTASSSGAGTWHTTANQSDLLNLYAYAHGYSAYYRKVFGPAADRQYTARSRLGKWDYTNNTFSTHIQSFSGSASGQATSEKVWEGHRTEMLGFVV